MSLPGTDDPAFLHYRDFAGGRMPRGGLSFLAALLWQRFRGRVALLALTACGGIALMSAEPVLLRTLVDNLRARPADAGWGPDLAWPFALIAAAWFLSSGFNRLREIVDLKTAPILRYEAQTALFSYLIEHAPGFFQDNFAGRLGQKVKQAGQAVVSLLTIMFNEIARLFVAIAIGVLLVAPHSPWFTALLLGWAVAYIAVSAALARRCLDLSRQLSDEVSASTGVLVDIATNADIVRSFARGPLEIRRVARAVADERAASQRLRWFLTLMYFILYSGLLAFQIGFIGLALNESVAGRMSLGDFVMAMSLAAIIGNNVWSLCARMLELFEQVGVLDSALDTILEPHAIIDGPAARALVVKRGAIAIERLTFGHGDGTPVFTDLDLAIAPGEKVGLVGPSGAGKSTLVKLIRRQYEPQAGRILIDGQDIAAVTLASLCESIADVPQDPGLFHRSIAENIRYARPEAGDAELADAAAKAHCDGFIGRRPGGYDAVVGERGVRLSGGERQRIAIARAFLKRSRILILDEATSALDSETEQLIRDALWHLFEGRTVIAIAHRLSTINRMDRILYLDQGRILEAGRHEELLARQGPYARLWQRQVDGFVG